MLNVTLLLGDQDCARDWWIRRKVQMPVVPTRVYVGEFSFEVDAVEYHLVTGEIKIVANGELRDVLAVYLAGGWEVEGGENSFSTDRGATELLAQLRAGSAAPRS